MGKALYRKYRSKSLDEVVGQEHITTTLKNALKQGKISHAYLFTGPRGVGKTSIARILAHEVNQLPYSEETNHLDIIEIDAASNRRIDEIRDLRDKVHITPTSAKYKVYIIDEVHMLTKEAFNALLKTLEEPPSHVIFILATTEAHKLPETIISRTQRFTFKPIDREQAKKHLSGLAKAEKISIDDEALELIAEHGDGSFRDSISLLDQASSVSKTVTLADIQRMLGIAPSEALDNLLTTLSSDQPKDILTQLAAMRDQGYQAAHIAKQLGQVLRQRLLDGRPAIDAAHTTKLLRQLLDVPASQHPDRLLEIILLDIVLNNQAMALPQAPSANTTTSPVAPPSDKKPTKPKTTNEPRPVAAKSAVPGQAFALEQWPQVLATIKSKHNTLYSVLRMGTPSLDGQTLTLAFNFGFHQKRVSEPKNQQVLAATLKQFNAEPIEIVCITQQNDALQPTRIKPPDAHKADIETISNIFGGAELLDS